MIWFLRSMSFYWLLYNSIPIGLLWSVLICGFSRLDFLEVLSGYMWDCAIIDSALLIFLSQILGVLVNGGKSSASYLSNHMQISLPVKLEYCRIWNMCLFCSMQYGKVRERQSSGNPQKEYQSSTLNAKW